MYYAQQPSTTSLKINTAVQGETIEQKVSRIVNNKEPIKDGAPITYTERQDGVIPAFDVRTDRFELAVEMTDYQTKSKLAKREQSIGERTYDTMNDTQKAEFHKKFPNNKHTQTYQQQQQQNKTEQLS